MIASMRYGTFAVAMRFGFKHAAADRREAQSVIVELMDEEGRAGYGEGCPRSYVTGETTEGATGFLSAFDGKHLRSMGDTESDLQDWIDAHQDWIDENPAAFCALEGAFIDLIAQRAGVPVEALLGARPATQPIQYSAVLGDASPGKTRLMATAYRAFGLRDFKVKAGADTVRDARRLAHLPNRAPIRLDANNLWTTAEACIGHIRSMPREIWAIEEPVTAGDVTAMRTVAEELGVRIILDESLTNERQLENYAGDPQRWIANIRVSKCGGVLRALRLARAAQEQGMEVILGAHVAETSLLTRAALAVGQALERPPVAREGAYGKILLRDDLVTPSLRFSYGGALVPDKYNLGAGPGWGMRVEAALVTWNGPSQRPGGR